MSFYAQLYGKEFEETGDSEQEPLENQDQSYHENDVLEDMEAYPGGDDDSYYYPWYYYYDDAYYQNGEDTSLNEGDRQDSDGENEGNNGVEEGGNAPNPNLLEPQEAGYNGYEATEYVQPRFSYYGKHGFRLSVVAIS